MGAYLSEPKTSKDSSDHIEEGVKCGASSMQGWRISQEDAHNCILKFDKDSFLFAVYDGHGGHEVAEYCSKNLPDFIKKTDSYIKGDYEQALKDAFLGFDATLATPEVIEVLKKIASGKEDKPGSDGDDGSDSEEDMIDNLVEEANMPLEEVMAKYRSAPLATLTRLKGEGKPPVSPMLRARRSNAEAGPSSSGAGSSKGVGEVSSSSSSEVEASGTGLCNGHVNGEVVEAEEGENKSEAEVKVESSDKSPSKIIKTVSEGVTECKKISRTEPDSSGLKNGEADGASSCAESVGSRAVEEASATDEAISSTSPPKKKVSSAEIYKTLLQNDSDSEDEDETFRADAESDGSSDEAANDAEEDEDSSVDDEEDDDEDEEMECHGLDDVKEEPGLDSGCTAVVALLVGSKLFVANAGDSRCVVSREGKALEMSSDHKPEDEPERERIENAGGKVTSDGRVNGGLNLSRAIGDHSYKQVAPLPPQKQMITALPDVRTLSVEPGKDEFMVLACDGIWNSMTSQEVVDFVKTKLDQGITRLSQICEQLFDHCLAPNTEGDGTGCDNMTCVIVQFPSTDANDTTGGKRSADTHEEQPCSKRSKVEEQDLPATS